MRRNNGASMKTQFDPSDRRPLKLREIGWIRALAGRLAQAGVSPNTISIVGMIAPLLAGLLWAFTAGEPAFERIYWLCGVALACVRILTNNLDGLVAVEWGKATPVGPLYNEAPDRIADSALLIGAGYAHGGSVELGYLAAWMALFVSYVRILDRLAGAPSDFSGPMDKKGRTLVLLIASVYMGVMPSAFYFSWGPGKRWGMMAAALLIVVVGGGYTAGKRLRRAAAHLRAQA